MHLATSLPERRVISDVILAVCLLNTGLLIGWGHQEITPPRSVSRGSYRAPIVISVICVYFSLCQPSLSIAMEGNMSGSTLKYCSLLEKWRSKAEHERVTEIAKEIQGHFHLNTDQTEKVTQLARLICLKLSSKWKKNHRDVIKFSKNEANFLMSEVLLPSDFTSGARKTSGAPIKPFAECCYKTKKSKVQPLLDKYSAEELRFAADIAGPSTPPIQNATLSISLYQTLALTLDLDLSERKYEILYKYIYSFEAGRLPSLHMLNKFKQNFFPKLALCSDSEIEVDVHDMLTKTIDSIFKLIENDILINLLSSDLVLVSKWGMDGSSGHGTYKLPFTDSNKTDEFSFFEAFVPLLVKEKSSGNILWENPRPSSSHYCRPLKLIFCKEHSDLVMQEHSKFKKLFESGIENCKINVGPRILNVGFTFHFTMIDGSVCKVVTETKSCATCVICKALPSQLNSADVSQFKPIVENYQYGLSTLHCWIRFLECCLQIAFRLPLQAWKATEEYKLLAESKNKDDKKKIQEMSENIKKQAKTKIQEQFKVSLAISVSKPKQGYGSSNDGNTARIFFKNYKTSANITRLNEQLIYNFYTILRLLNCKRDINVDKFKNLTQETLNLYLKEYDWCKLPMTLHKILIHGSDIINHFDVPIGKMAEDCFEARHKEIRKERLNHTRKHSRVSLNIDLMNRLILTSDPHLASFRTASLKEKKQTSDCDIQQYFLQGPQDNDEVLSGLNNSVILNAINFNSDGDDDDDEPLIKIKERLINKQ